MKIVRSTGVAEVGVSHNGEIKKKVLLEKGAIPQLMNFSSAVFKPGQFVKTHNHPTMYEVFYILKGRAEFVVNEEKVLLGKGDCITIAPGEWHSQSNPYEENVEWVYFGIATD
ncbi:cupin domain-containing protein [Flavobacteriaceae bacterium KMM 6897]|nr:cupin domain-containing protein [Flavobacteriaceae bacterium KMM 6897]MEB8344872.1 cupin domain-containing protein [Flavobacteriaceae bacterium KMM 6898]